MKAHTTTTTTTTTITNTKDWANNAHKRMRSWNLFSISQSTIITLYL
jgi:hypothetical protein